MAYNINTYGMKRKDKEYILKNLDESKFIYKLPMDVK